MNIKKKDEQNIELLKNSSLPNQEYIHPDCKHWTTSLRKIVLDKNKSSTTIENKLVFLDIELTERCCLSCEHCYIKRPRRDSKSIKKEMTTQFIYEVLKDTVEMGCNQIRFTGGEPMVRDDFMEIYEYAHDLGLQVSLATNAVLIDDKIIALFNKKPPADVNISIYGWNEKTYDKIVKVPGSYKKFINGVNKLKMNSIPFRMRYPAIPELVNNRDKINEKTRQLGAIETTPHTWELTHHAWNDIKRSEQISFLRLSPQQAAIEILKDKDLVNIIKEKLSRQETNKDLKSVLMFDCPAAGSNPSLNAYGQIQACLEVRHPTTLYDLTKGNLSNAMTEHFPKVKEMRITDPSFMKRCGRCLLRPACFNCPAISWMEYGVLDRPVEYYCEVMHAFAELIFVINKGEKAWEIECLK